MSARPSWPGSEDTARVALDNGLTLLVRENRAAPVVVLEGMLPVGAIDDPADRTGLSSLTANMLTRGSARYGYEEFNEAIESVGASLGITSDSDGTSFGITCLSEDFPALVDVLADALRAPAFPQDQFDLVRRQKLVRLQERDQETSAVASLRFYDAVYGGHPLGKPASGTIPTVGAITLDDVAAFHARHYTPQGGVVAISGDVERTAAVDLIASRLGDWRAQAAPRTLPPVPAVKPVRIDAPMADKVQSDLVLGVPGLARSHPDFYAVRLANTVLGVFGMMGRLGEVVREQQGLAYYVYSTQDSGRESGVWMAAAGVNPTQLARAEESILAELARLAREPVSAEELADSKAYLTGVVPLTLETNDGIASTLLNIEWYGLGLDFLSRYGALIDAVTIDDVQRVAQSYLRPEQMVIVTAGPM